jgi:hypothetical protein
LLLGSYVGDNKTFYLTKKDLSQSAKMAYLIVFSITVKILFLIYALFKGQNVLKAHNQ